MPLAPNINHEPVPTRDQYSFSSTVHLYIRIFIFIFNWGIILYFLEAIIATWVLFSRVSHCRQLERLIRLGPARFPALQSIM
ncbi:hypothetical protein CI102_257 [Trichoderma harzianum]|nr:hypothetical protein CI102_257 [Trichoderma harzianum]